MYITVIRVAVKLWQAGSAALLRCGRLEALPYSMPNYFVAKLFCNNFRYSVSEN